MQTKDEILESALRLPATERTEIAQTLWESLEDASSDAVDEASAEWESEILRRVDELRSGKVQGLAAEDVLARLKERRGGR